MRLDVAQWKDERRASLETIRFERVQNRRVEKRKCVETFTQNNK